MDSFDSGSSFSLSAFFASGNAVDVILVLVALEAGGLWLWHRMTGRGFAPVDLVAFLGAGFFLLLALRFAIGQVWWGLIALCLLGALACHLTDIWRRIRAGRDRYY